MPKVQISYLDEKDLPAVEESIRRISRTVGYARARRGEVKSWYYPPKRLRQIYRDTRSLFLGAYVKDELGGYLFGWNEYGVFWIDWLETFEDYRRLGLATMLLERCEDECRRRNVHKIFFDVAADNEEAQKFFRAHGYVREATLRRHWLGKTYYLFRKFIRPSS